MTTESFGPEADEVIARLTEQRLIEFFTPPGASEKYVRLTEMGMLISEFLLGAATPQQAMEIVANLRRAEEVSS